jgi:nicotinate-nucleotide adenylyltransferase
MKVAFFGGSFDPPHSGHLALAKLAIDRLHLDRVLFAPVGVQPLKQKFPPAPFHDRVAMVTLAIAGQPQIEVSLVDAPKATGRPNYTFDTIRRLKTSFDPLDEFFSLTGADSFLTIGKWYRAADLLMDCSFIVGARPGFDLGRIAAALPETLSVAAEEAELRGCLILGLRNDIGQRSRLYLLPDLDEGISATEIRAELHAGKDPEAALSPTVMKYIRQHGLYRPK